MENTSKGRSEEDRARLVTRLLLSATAVVGIFLHKSGKVDFDLVTLCLLVLGILPWLSTVIKSLELPGGFKIELQEAKAKAEEAVRTAEEAKSAAASAQTRSRLIEKGGIEASATSASAPKVSRSGEQTKALAAALVADYLKIREEHKSGPLRTELMERKMAEMIGLAREYPEFDWKSHLEDPNNGWRLFTYAYLVAHPQFDRLDATAASAWKFRAQRKTSFDDNKPFGEYWSIRAMQELAALRDTAKVSTATRDTLLNHYRLLDAGTDRHYEMRQLLGLLDISV